MLIAESEILRKDGEGMKLNRAIVLALLCVLVSAFAFFGSEEVNAGNPMGQDNPTVTAPTGKYTGNDSDGVQEFLGIRYAAPVKRWMPPTDVKTTKKNEFSATRWGPGCMQPYDELQVVTQGGMSEDCLTLNVWTKDAKVKKKPVLVFIHGGGFMSGGSHDPRYEGDNFIRNLGKGEDAVFVSINYRTNVFGSIDLSELKGYKKEYGNAVNLWMLDQIQALKWISENISAFGGDPKNVTLCGQGSGGMAITYMLAKPETHKYFQRVIIESGAPFSASETKAKKLEEAEMLYGLLGVDDMKELLALSDETIKERGLTDYFEEIGAEAGIYADGKIIPTDWWEKIRNGSAKDIDVLIGVTNGEKDLVAYDSDSYKTVRKNAKEIWSEVITAETNKRSAKYGTQATYFLNPLKQNGTPSFAVSKFLRTQKDQVKAMTDLYNAMNSVQGTEYLAEALSEYSDTYLYQWTYAPNGAAVRKYCDANELAPMVSPYGRALSSTGMMFALGNASYGCSEYIGDPKTLDQRPSKLMQSAVYNYIKTGKPAGKGIPKWKAYEKKNRETMVIGAKWSLAKDPRKAQRTTFTARPQGEKAAGKK